MEKTVVPASSRFCCQNCDHAWDHSAQLACRRYPPLVTTAVIPEQNPLNGQMALRVQNQTFFPVVSADWYCGEFSSGGDYPP